MAAIPEDIHHRWKKERIQNIHDSEAIAQRYGWHVVEALIELEIRQRKQELQDGTRQSFFNSDQEERANRWLKKVLSHSNPTSPLVRLLKETP